MRIVKTSYNEKIRQNNYRQIINREFDELKLKIGILKIATKKDISNEIKEGDFISNEYFKQKEFRTPKDAFEYMKIFTGQWWCIYYKQLFLDSAINFDNPDRIRAEIAILEGFKNNIGSNDLKAAQEYKTGNNIISQPDSNKIEQYEYLLLKTNYYNDWMLKPNCLTLSGNQGITPKIYGKYFLFYDFLKIRLEKLKMQEPEQKIIQVPKEGVLKENKITAPVIALFCLIVSNTKIIVKFDYESVSSYCKKVCEKFNLNYTERVRINFNGGYTNRNIDKVKKLILPKIDSNTSNIFIAHLNEYLANKNK